MNTDTTTLSAMAGELGSLTAALGGLDALVFTGGIGEHAVAIRVAAWVIPTNEELMLARHTRALLDADARRLRS